MDKSLQGQLQKLLNSWSIADIWIVIRIWMRSLVLFVSTIRDVIQSLTYYIVLCWSTYQLFNHKFTNLFVCCSVGSILGCRTEILQLDVTDVKMDCFQAEWEDYNSSGSRDFHLNMILQPPLVQPVVCVIGWNFGTETLLLLFIETFIYFRELCFCEQILLFGNEVPTVRTAKRD